MKALVIFSILSAVSAAAIAQTEPESGSVTISGAKPRIELPSKVNRVWQGDFDNLKGGYDLANGKTLYLTSRLGRMYGGIEGEEKTQLVAVASNVFVALNKQMKVTLDRHMGGEVTGELLIAVAPPSPQQAKVGVPAKVVAVSAHR